MIETTIRDKYYSLLRSHFANPQEEYLAQAAELGKALVMANIPPEEIAELHEHAIQRLGAEFPEAKLIGVMDKLMVQLLQIHSVPDRKISPVVHAVDCSLPVSIAVPVGLIANELLTNAFKHAFVNKKQGKIEVSLGASEKGAVSLTVSDDGVGLPEEFDINASKTLGLHVVKILAEEQLDGNLEVVSDNGTTFKVEFEMGEE